MTELHELLTATRERLTPPEAWTTGEYSRRDPDGLADIEPDDPNATCWCLIGALLASHHALGGQRDPDLGCDEYTPGSILAEAVDTLASHAQWDDGSGDLNSHDIVTGFNDTHRHDEVLALLDRTIEDITR